MTYKSRILNKTAQTPEFDIISLNYLQMDDYVNKCRSQWPPGLRRRSVAARLLELCIRIPLWALSFSEWCALSDSGLCNELTTRAEGPTDCSASLCVI
jgi:hypothetical protein